MMLSIRDAVQQNGKILEYDEGNQMMVAVIRTGVMNAASALVVIRIKDNAIEFASYGKEGIIKQNLAANAIEKIKQKI